MPSCGLDDGVAYRMMGGASGLESSGHVDTGSAGAPASVFIASGQNPNWFFECWYFGSNYIDLAVADVQKTTPYNCRGSSVTTKSSIGW